MKFFSVDNVVWRSIAKLGQIWVLDLIWLLCCLPVVTIGGIYNSSHLQLHEAA